MNIKNNRYYYLDMIKFVATLLIVFHHYQQLLEVEFSRGMNFYYGKFYYGNLVELFFLISGFIIYSYVENIQNGLSFEKFYARRFFRVFPLMAISIIIHSLLLQMKTVMPIEQIVSSNSSLTSIIVSCLGLQSWFPQLASGLNNPVWYISSLLLCYIIFYFLVYIAKRCEIQVKYLFMVVVILGVCIHIYNVNLPFLNSMTARGYYSFFAGLILADYVSKHNISSWITYGCLIIIGVFIYLINFNYSFLEKGFEYLLSFILYPSLIIVAQSKIMNRIANCKIWNILGPISFDVYIWHFIVITLVYKTNIIYGLNINFSSHKIMLAEAVLIYIIGAVSYYCLERPLANLMKKYSIYQ